MAIEKNPYASDQAGGYDMFTGDYEVTKQSLWERLIAVLRGSGDRVPSKQEFDQYYDQTEGQPNASSGGNPLFPPEMASDLRLESAARKPVPAGQGASDSSWQRMLEALKGGSYDMPMETPKDEEYIPGTGEEGTYAEQQKRIKYFGGK